MTYRTGQNPVTNAEDIIDSREVIERIAYLEAERDAYDEDEASAAVKWAAENPDEAEELRALLAFQADADGCPDWEYGATFIRDSYFREYAETYADEVCDMKSNTAWPFCYIDWGAAADALQADYTAYDFDGVTYWANS